MKKLIFFLMWVSSLAWAESCYKATMSIEQLWQCAEQGNASAQSDLGVMYFSGNGISQDYQKAFEWFSKAAPQGDIQAQYSLGFMYHQGQGVAQNYAKAAQWYSQAAEQNDAFAQFTLGYMYLSGLGVAQDDVLAYQWFDLAALQNDIDAVKNRDDLVKKMTPEQLSKAKQLSADWLAKHRHNP